MSSEQQIGVRDEFACYPDEYDPDATFTQRIGELMVAAVDGVLQNPKNRRIISRIERELTKSDKYSVGK